MLYMTVSVRQAAQSTVLAASHSPITHLLAHSLTHAPMQAQALTRSTHSTYSLMLSCKLLHILNSKKNPGYRNPQTSALRVWLAIRCYTQWLSLCCSQAPSWLWLLEQCLVWCWAPCWCGSGRYWARPLPSSLAGLLSTHHFCFLYPLIIGRPPAY